jgi:hypothetical protein
MIKINGTIVDRFQADNSTWSGEFNIDPVNHNTLHVEHYGKNYITDSIPDKYFELLKIYINDVDLKHHIYRLQQTAFLAPWDHEQPPTHSLYLGHNGYLELEFASPIDQWIQSLFNLTEETMHDQTSSKSILQEVKKYFESNP